MKTRSMTFRVPEDVFEDLRAAAEEQKITLTEVVVARLKGVGRDDVVAQVGRAPRVTGEARSAVDPVATPAEVGGSNPSPSLPACEHPKVRQVNVVGGKKCLECGATKQLNSGWRNG